MTTSEKKEEIVQSLIDMINQTDFHVPEYISGISHKSPEYGKLLDDETKLLAIQCAIISVNRIILAFESSFHKNILKFDIEYYKIIKQELEFDMQVN